VLKERITIRNTQKLDLASYLWLEIGAGRGLWGPFQGEREARQAWQTHRAQILAEGEPNGWPSWGSVVFDGVEPGNWDKALAQWRRELADAEQRSTTR